MMPIRRAHDKPNHSRTNTLDLPPSQPKVIAFQLAIMAEWERASAKLALQTLQLWTMTADIPLSASPRN